ncbi:MAG TPA: peptidylprolyl isomerase [Micromonosporaceae bacterium]|nr:peptidylprolyl isomerase [Micromonosporaceae bacterium]
MAERAESAQKRRRVQLIGAGAGTAVVILGMVWLVVAVSSDDDKKPTAAASESASAAACQWKPKVDPSAASAEPLPPEIKDVGTPPASGEPRSGKSTMTITTNLGELKATLDLSKVPCTAANFSFLASKNYFDNTECHRMTTEGIHVLQCGDPSATGRGGPTYQYTDENLPTNRRPAYPEGTIAMANAGPNTNGSQFFIVYKDTELQPNYTVLGKVDQASLDIVKKVAEAGVVDADPQQPGDGKPKTQVKISDLTVGAPQT